MGSFREELASDPSLKEGKCNGGDGGKGPAGAKTGRWEYQPEV